MATEHFLTAGEIIVGYVEELGDGSDFEITVEKTRRSLKIETLTLGAACDVKHISATDGDLSNPDTTITLDSFSGPGISQGNEIPVVSGGPAVRITNTSGGPADYIAVGRFEKPVDILEA